MRKVCFYLFFASLAFSACGIPEDTQPNIVDSPIGVRTEASSELLTSDDVREEIIYLFDEKNLLVPVLL